LQKLIFNAINQLSVVQRGSISAMPPHCSTLLSLWRARFGCVNVTV